MLGELEVAQLCKKLDFKVAKKDVKALMTEIDLEGKGRVDIFEFAAWWEENGWKKFSETQAGAKKKGEPSVKIANPMMQADDDDDEALDINGAGVPVAQPCCAVQ